jgi:hypothetical protein
MEVGRTSRTVVAAIGVVREPDGSEHEVSFSSPGPELQIATVVGPGRLGLESRRTSLAFVPGDVLAVPVKVSRGPGVEGPIRVELAAPRPSQSLWSDPLIIAAGQDEGVVRIVCGTTDVRPLTDRVVLQAVGHAESGPVTAETRLTLVAGP